MTNSALTPHPATPGQAAVIPSASFSFTNTAAVIPATPVMTSTVQQISQPVISQEETQIVGLLKTSLESFLRTNSIPHNLNIGGFKTVTDFASADVLKALQTESGSHEASLTKTWLENLTKNLSGIAEDHLNSQEVSQSALGSISKLTNAFSNDSTGASSIIKSLLSTADMKYPNTRNIMAHNRETQVVNAIKQLLGQLASSQPLAMTESLVGQTRWNSLANLDLYQSLLTKSLTASPETAASELVINLGKMSPGEWITPESMRSMSMKIEATGKAVNAAGIKDPTLLNAINSVSQKIREAAAAQKIQLPSAQVITNSATTNLTQAA